MFFDNIYIIQKRNMLIMYKAEQAGITDQMLQEIGHHIKINHYSTAFSLCNNLEKEIIDRSKLEFSPLLFLNCHGKKEIQEAFDLLEVESLKSYCLMHLDEIDDAREALEKCLKICPNHAPSNRRLASLYEKEGNFEESLGLYKKMGLREPDNVHITHSIIKLTKKLKSYSSMSSLQKIQGNQVSKTTIEEPSHSGKSSKQHVTFGASEVIEITSDQSDEYFAHIKQELNKLNEIKPKKSILKGSKANKDSSSNPYYPHSQEEKIEMEEMTIKKTFSMKSCSTQSPLKWQSDSLQEEKLISSVSPKKQKKKKKCVSFSVGKDIAQDKQ